METNSKSLKIVLITIAVGIWALVFQNAGIIPTNQNVRVQGGYIDVSGSVDVDNTVSVSGYVDVNLESINGKSNAFYDFGGDGNHVRIPVMTTSPRGY